MNKQRLITTPIYYVNDRPHIGHAYTTVVCDVLARFHRLHGDEVLFTTGTDEHGQKVQKSAALAGIAPKDFVDDVSQHFRNLLPLIGVSPDDFIRTTDDRHREAVIHLWNILVERDQIYKGTYGGWYALKDEAYYTESEVTITENTDGGKIVTAHATGATCEWVEEEAYFFRLSQWGDELLKLYETDFVQPVSRRNEVRQFVKGGLNDLCVSRSSISWGISVPGDEKHVIYVWADALTNYLTVAGYPKTDWTGYDVTHVVGKDIVRFHAVYWPAFLLAAGLPVPNRVFAHGWWTRPSNKLVKQQKIGKSEGNAVSVPALIEKYGLDALRYFLLREVNFGDDGEFSEDAIAKRYNSELANDLGNLLNRALTLLHRHCDGIVRFSAVGSSLTSRVETYASFAQAAFAALDFRGALEHLHAATTDINRVFSAAEPWKLKDDPDKLNEVLSDTLQNVVKVAFLLQPVIPASAEKILKLCSAEIRHLEVFIPYEAKLPEPSIVFPRIEVQKNA